MAMLNRMFQLFGVVLAVSVLVALVAPKAAHAAIVRLVQLVPGTVTHVGQNQDNLVYLDCNFGGPCKEVSPTGQVASSAYLVPRGYTLIITDYEWEAYEGTAGAYLCDSFVISPPQGPMSGAILLPSCAIADIAGRADGKEHYTTGIRVATDFTVIDYDASQGYGLGSIQGYLVPNINITPGD